MEPGSRTGRIVGVLIILQTVGSASVNFYLEAPLFGSPGFLQNAAPHATQIALGALLGIVAESLAIGIAVMVFPLFYERARALAFWYAALSAAILAVAVAEAGTVMSMISVSEAYLKATPAGQEQLQAFRVVVASARNWVHFLARLLDGAAAFVFYAALYRLALVPRWIGGLGLIAVLLMMTGLSMPFWGSDVIFPLLAPLALAQIALVVWLLVKGFR